MTRYAPTKKEASALLADMGLKRRTGRLAAPTKITVGEWLDTWLEDRRRSIRPTTYRKYELAVRVHLKPELAQMRLSRLNSALVSHVVGQVADESPFMAVEVRQVLKMACDYAVRLGVLEHNPVAAVPSPRRQAKQRHRWTPDEFRQFVRWAEATEGTELWLVLLGTGMRLGEALGLQWNDIDLDAKALSIRRAVSFVAAKRVLGEPKSKAGIRTISLPDFTVNALRRQRVHQAEWRLAAGPEWQDSRGAAFTSADGSTPSASALWQRFQRDCAKADVPRMRVHDLRHVHASVAVSSGADPKSLQARLGHATLEMTLNVYSHHTRHEDRALASKLDEATC